MVTKLGTFLCVSLNGIRFLCFIWHSVFERSAFWACGVRHAVFVLTWDLVDSGKGDSCVF